MIKYFIKEQLQVFQMGWIEYILVAAIAYLVVGLIMRVSPFSYGKIGGTILWGIMVIIVSYIDYYCKTILSFIFNNWISILSILGSFGLFSWISKLIYDKFFSTKAKTLRKIFSDDGLRKLLKEMKKDLIRDEYNREFYLMEKGWHFNFGGERTVYYYEDHDNLKNKIKYLENNGLIYDVTEGNVKKYRMTEIFIKKLKK